MNNQEARKQQFLARPMSQQLGELAAALSTFVSLTTQRADRPDIAQQLLDEPICYATWLASGVSSQLQTEISNIHTCLQEWQREWLEINANDIQRRTIIKQVREWSEQMLEASGVLQQIREVA